MTKKHFVITAVGWLSLLYGLVLVASVVFFASALRGNLVLDASPFVNQFSNIAEFQRYTVILWILLVPQFIGLVAVLKLKEWGRKIVVATSGLMCLYFFYLTLLEIKRVNLYSLSTIVVYLSVILFFNLSNIRKRFQGGGQYRRILVVDDDQGARKIMNSILTSSGFEVLLAETGEQGLMMAQKEKPDLIILDVIMPGIKGREVCIRLKKDPTTKHIPVVFLTAKDSPDDIKAELEAGAVAHLTKPLDLKEVLVEIKKVLER